MYKHARGFSGTKPFDLRSHTPKRGLYGKGPSIGPIGPKPKGRPNRAKKKIKLVPIKRVFTDPEKTIKAKKIAANLNRRMKGVVVEKKSL